MILFFGRSVVDSPLIKPNNARVDALKRSTIMRFRLDDLRHTRATRAAMAGVDFDLTVKQTLAYS